MKRGPAILKRRPRVTADTIRAFYARFPAMIRPAAPEALAGRVTLTNTPTGIGDCVVLLDCPNAASLRGETVHAWSPSPHWKPLESFASGCPTGHPPLYVSLTEANAAWDLGPGHNTQRARRLFGLPVWPVPPPWLNAVGVRQIRNRVSFHFEAGGHSVWQRANLHPRARQVYPDTWKALREFVKKRPDLSFIEVGRSRCLPMDEIEDGTGRPLDETVRLMAECSFHIGVVSGPMHIAAALGSHVVALLNFPRPSQLMLPNLKRIGMVEEEWLYPQQVCLHQEEDSAHWPKVSARTLSEAINGEVYPYWSHQIADELHEI